MSSWSWVTTTNVILHDIVPVQYTTFLSASNGYSYNGANGVITWSLGTLTPTMSGLVTFTARVNNFVQDQATIANIAYIDSDQSLAAGSNIVRTAALASNVELSKLGPTVSRQGKVITLFE